MQQQKRRLLVVEEDTSDLGFGDTTRNSGLSDASSGRFSVPRLSCMPGSGASAHDDIIPMSVMSPRLSIASKESSRARYSVTPRHTVASAGVNEEDDHAVRREQSAQSSTSSVAIVELEESWPIVTVLLDGVAVAVSDSDGMPMLDDASLRSVSLKDLDRARLAAGRINRKLHEMIARLQRGETDDNSAKDCLEVDENCQSTSGDESSSDEDEGSESDDEDEASASDDSFDSDEDFGSRRKKRVKGKVAKRAPSSSVKKRSAQDVSTNEGRNTNNLTKQELQAILRAAKLPISGRKSALVRRVRDQRPAAEPPRVSHELSAAAVVTESHISSASPDPQRLSQRGHVAVSTNSEVDATQPQHINSYDATPLLHGTPASSHQRTESEDSSSAMRHSSLTQKIGFVTPARIFRTIKSLFSSRSASEEHEFVS
ncbi:Hypothetical protein, putative [Bodo saltans]|uniref:SAP domain-containing protein n=1 Tax=Bodo saltans TaxID=75058 RepID=A0A0S4JID4_BODSA|nr:Hypothetical protein, putative [Bodo saltans]|eukprot:CUG91282.1 Hypothetical protein, putative [Bodo saltans]